MWYLITAIISGAVGAFLMGLVAGAKMQEECRKNAERPTRQEERRNVKSKLMKLIDFYLNTYRCDPEKNKECRKTGCYINGGPCKRTSKRECRK